jgi:hypothetical protein
MNGKNIATRPSSIDVYYPISCPGCTGVFLPTKSHQASGVSWQPSVPPPVEIDYKNLTLEAVSQFSQHFERLLFDSGKTLDQLVGVVMVDEYPAVFAAISRLLEQVPPLRIEKHDLKKGPGPDAQLGGMSLLFTSICLLNSWPTI